MTPEQAIEIMALEAIHHACADGIDRGDYWKISDRDWAKVRLTIDRLVPMPAGHEEAYELLTWRATH